jgi:hypothetical protein
MKPKRPRDTNQLAKLIVGLTTREVQEPEAHESSAAVRGRRGGQKGGRARAEALSPARRKAIAQKAAAALWRKKKKAT